MHRTLLYPSRKSNIVHMCMYGEIIGTCKITPLLIGRAKPLTTLKPSGRCLVLREGTHSLSLFLYSMKVLRRRFGEPRHRLSHPVSVPAIFPSSPPPGPPQFLSIIPSFWFSDALKINKFSKIASLLHALMMFIFSVSAPHVF